MMNHYPSTTKADVSGKAVAAGETELSGNAGLSDNAYLPVRTVRSAKAVPAGSVFLSLQLIIMTAILVALLAMVLTGCSPALLGKPSLAVEVQSAVSSGSVTVDMDGSTAVLSGHVPSRYDAQAAVRAAARYEGVEEVIDHIFVADHR